MHQGGVGAPGRRGCTMYVWVHQVGVGAPEWAHFTCAAGTCTYTGARRAPTLRRGRWVGLISVGKHQGVAQIRPNASTCAGGGGVKVWVGPTGATANPLSPGKTPILLGASKGVLAWPGWWIKSTCQRRTHMCWHYALPLVSSVLNVTKEYDIQP